MRNAKPKFNCRVANLGDDSGLRWVSLLPEGVINAHGQQWRFNADETKPDALQFRFDDAVESLTDWLNDFAPAIAIEHEKNGKAAGYLRRIKVLTKDEAAKLGINQPAPRMIYGGLDITSPFWADAFDAGEIPYVSPNIRASAGTEADATPRYPFAIGEVSFVTIPQIKSAQIPVADLRGISLSEGDIMTTRESLAAYCTEKGMAQSDIDDMLLQVFGPIHDELHKEMDIEKAVEDIEAGTDEADAVKPDAEKEDDKEDEALLSEINRLKAALLSEKRARATFVVKSALGNRKVSTATEAALADAYLTDAAKYQALLKDFGHTIKPSVAPAAAPRSVMPMARVGASVNLADCLSDGAKFDALSDDAQWALICDLADKEKCNHWQAASWLRYGRMPDSVQELRNSGAGRKH
jgi:hypothetical protein